MHDGSCKAGEPMDVHEIPCTGAISAKDLFADIDFEKVYWRKRPVLLRRHCAATYDKLAFRDLSRMFPDAIAGGEENGQVQLSSFRDGDEYVRIIAFYANIFLGYLDGASVVYNQVDTMWPHAAQFIKGDAVHGRSIRRHGGGGLTVPLTCLSLLTRSGRRRFDGGLRVDVQARVSAVHESLHHPARWVTLPL